MKFFPHHKKCIYQLIYQKEGYLIKFPIFTEKKTYSYQTHNPAYFISLFVKYKA